MSQKWAAPCSYVNDKATKLCATNCLQRSSDWLKTCSNFLFTSAWRHEHVLVLARPALQPADDRGLPGIFSDRYPDARARHRCEHGHLFRRERGASRAPSLPSARQTRHGLAQERSEG